MHFKKLKKERIPKQEELDENLMKLKMQEMINVGDIICYISYVIIESILLINVYSFVCCDYQQGEKPLERVEDFLQRYFETETKDCNKLEFLPIKLLLEMNNQLITYNDNSAAENLLE